VTLPATITVCGAVLTQVRAHKGRAVWECRLLEEPRVRIGVEVDDLGRSDLPPLARGYVTVDGGPDFHVAAMDTIESAVEELTRAVTTLRAALGRLAP